jgi:hypothetical protein
MFPGIGTLINICTILMGTALGVSLGSRLPERTRSVITDVLGLVTAVIAISAGAEIASPSLKKAVGSAALLIVLGALLIGGIIGSLLRLEERLNNIGETIKSKFGKGDNGNFVEGFVTASLIFVVGPLSILASVSDGLGKGINQLLLKSTLDFFASMAFAASLGWGVAASAIVVGLYQGAWTFLGWLLGNVMSDFEIAAMTATGGLMLAGIALRLLKIRQVPIGDLLPALAIAPLLALVVSKF